MSDTFDHEADAWNESIDRNDTYLDDDPPDDIGWVCPTCDTWYPSSMLSCSFCTPNQEDYLDHE